MPIICSPARSSISFSVATSEGRDKARCGAAEVTGRLIETQNRGGKTQAAIISAIGDFTRHWAYRGRVGRGATSCAQIIGRNATNPTAPTVKITMTGRAIRHEGSAVTSSDAGTVTSAICIGSVLSATTRVVRKILVGVERVAIFSH